MRYPGRTFATVLLAVAFASGSAAAQASQRGQPRTAFSVSDFAKLGWLSGTWEGTSPGEATHYARFAQTSDSTIDVTYYSDADLQHKTASGRVYLSVGRVYYTYGPGRWGASNVSAQGAYFVPQTTARSSYAWAVESPDSWTATLRTGVSGHDRVVVYTMKRLAK